MLMSNWRSDENMRRCSIDDTHTAPRMPRLFPAKFSSCSCGEVRRSAPDSATNPSFRIALFATDTYIYTHIVREKERETERARESERAREKERAREREKERERKRERERARARAGVSILIATTYLKKWCLFRRFPSLLRSLRDQFAKII